MRRNTRSNTILKWCVIIGDMLVLNGLLFLFRQFDPLFSTWPDEKVQVFWLVNNLAMVLAFSRYMTIIHQRVVSAGDILRRMAGLLLLHFVLAYFIMKIIDLELPIGWLMVRLELCLVFCGILNRFVERNIVKFYRGRGFNIRSVTFVGADSELDNIYEKLIKNPTTGYRVGGYYADEESEKMKQEHIERLGTIADLMESIEMNADLEIGDEVYVCLPRRENLPLRELSDYCDRHVIRFYFVPMLDEKIGMRLEREYIDDIEVFTNHEIPLENPVNKMLKRGMDIIFSSLVLLFCLPLFPIIALIIKLQSPGPILFRQLRTGLNGDNFVCYKFRSMHVNADADRLQATEDDPRKFPFGNIMRKYNLDELPQFWNVLKGNMSVVGPRPHMLAHTEMYSELIRQYMVRHFVKPGITGWAQVTGFRGETKELWQMEERIKRDIWYMEHWTIWLDIRIIWMTAKTIVVHDKMAF